MPGSETNASASEVYAIEVATLALLPDVNHASGGSASSSLAADISKTSILAAGWLPGISTLLGSRTAGAATTLSSAHHNSSMGKSLLTTDCQCCETGTCSFEHPASFKSPLFLSG